MKNQNSIWDKAHADNRLDHDQGGESSFAREVVRLIPEGSKILELGCGVGSDAAFFAQNGHDVAATDFSKSAIEHNAEKYNDVENLQFFVQDISEPFMFKDKEFDVVYARLSLHYFTDEVTRKVIKEISRVLKPDGLLTFICKSTKDPLYGKGKKIEDDMFEADHIRHFFSEEYVRNILKDSFKTIEIKEGEENFYKKRSKYVKAIACRR